MSAARKVYPVWHSEEHCQQCPSKHDPPTNFIGVDNWEQGLQLHPSSLRPSTMVFNIQTL
eukprot:434433-Amphidinium_carterae.1